MTSRALAVGLLFGLAAIPRAARGQSSGGITIDAEVIGVGMTITTLRNLDFGQVTKGIATSVLPTAAGAGEWQVTGNKNAFALVTFTLRNANDYPVKDIELFCSFLRRDGSHLTDRRRLISDVVNMKSRKTFARMHIGFVNVNADKAKCSLLTASRI